VACGRRLVHAAGRPVGAFQALSTEILSSLQAMTRVWIGTSWSARLSARLSPTSSHPEDRQWYYPARKPRPAVSSFCGRNNPLRQEAECATPSTE
jgi:hypothetical protein